MSTGKTETVTMEMTAYASTPVEALDAATQFLMERTDGLAATTGAGVETEIRVATREHGRNLAGDRFVTYEVTATVVQPVQPEEPQPEGSL